MPQLPSPVLFRDRSSTRCLSDEGLSRRVDDLLLGNRVAQYRKISEDQAAIRPKCMQSGRRILPGAPFTGVRNRIASPESLAELDEQFLVELPIHQVMACDLSALKQAPIRWNAYTLKDKVVSMLDPKPIPYQPSNAETFNRNGYLRGGGYQ